MNLVIWNGKLCREEEVQIPLTDRGFLFGDGVFTTLKMENGRVDALDRHLRMFENQCRELGIAPPGVQEPWIEALVTQNQASNGIWRLKIIVTGGHEESLRLPPQRQGQLILTLKPYTGPSFTPLHLGLYPTPLHTSAARVKSLAYLDRLLIKEYALSQGVYDCLVKDSEGHILETAFANIFWKIGRQILIPDPALLYYFGASLSRVVEAAAERQYIKAKEIPQEACVYLCNSMMGICPVISIDSQSFARDAAFEHRFREAYERVC